MCVGSYVASRAWSFKAVRIEGGLCATGGGGDLGRLGFDLVIFLPVDMLDVDRWSGDMALFGLGLPVDGVTALSVEMVPNTFSGPVDRMKSAKSRVVSVSN